MRLMLMHLSVYAAAEMIGDHGFAGQIVLERSDGTTIDVYETRGVLPTATEATETARDILVTALGVLCKEHDPTRSSAPEGT